MTSTQRRGAEVFAVELGEALANEGARVTTAALVGAPSGDGIDVPILGRRAIGATTLRGLRRAAHEADVVVAHGSRTLPAAAIALIGSRAPFVYRNIGDPLQWSGTGARHWRTRAFLRRSAHVVALSAGAAETLRSSYAVPSGRITVIPTGASADRNRPATPQRRLAARFRYGLASDAIVALLIGALSEEKCAQVAIDAVGLCPALDLVVAGDGPERPRLEEHARRIAPGRVHFVGSLDDPSPAYDASDVVVVTSRTEGLPAVLIEAGLRSIPCVATDVGYVRDIVTHGDSGYLAPAGDAHAIARGLSFVTGPRAGWLGSHLREHCLGNFELSAVAEEWSALLERIVRTRSA